MTPDQTVTEFIRRMETRDVSHAFELCADDLHYENVPMPPAHTTKQAALDFLAGFMGGTSDVEWVTHRQTATGTTVMNERTDRFKFGETWVGVKVVGVWEVEGGLITFWRDYFDSAEMTEALASIG